MYCRESVFTLCGAFVDHSFSSPLWLSGERKLTAYSAGKFTFGPLDICHAQAWLTSMLRSTGISIFLSLPSTEVSPPSFALFPSCPLNKMFKTRHWASEFTVPNVTLMRHLWLIVLLGNELLCNPGSVKHLKNASFQMCNQNTTNFQGDTSDKPKISFSHQIQHLIPKKTQTTHGLFG